MGTAERREREKLQRQEAIIDAAEEVFFEKSYKNSTMDDVAEEAELSKGTLYLYFKSKEHLYLAICVRGMRLLSDAFSEAVDGCGNGLECVLNIGKAYVKYSQDHPDYFMAMSYRESIDPKSLEGLTEDPIVVEATQIQHSALEILMQTIESGKADGTIRSEIDTTTTALLLWAQSNGVIQLQNSIANHFEAESDLTGLDLIEAYYEFVLRSISAQNR